METRTLTCITCPLGCQLSISMKNEILNVTGNACKRGEMYARKEIANPTRIITSTVPVVDGEIAMLPVKTNIDIPKEKIHECIRLLKPVSVHAPVAIGDIVLHNIAETGADIVATKRVRRSVYS